MPSEVAASMRSILPARLVPALLLAAVLASGGCARLSGEGRLVEAEAGPGPGQTQRLLRMADDAAAAGDAATAANLYGRVVALEPNDREAARRLGAALLRLGRFQDAIDAFRRVLAADPGEPEASRGIARALLELGRPDAALAAVEEGLARAPEDPRLLNAKGVALDQLGRHEEAQAVYRAGLARWPENASLRNNLGLSLALAGRYGEAIGELEPLARGPQENPRARHNLAAAYALKGDLETAESLLKLDLGDADVRSTLAYYTALRGLGSPRSARAMLRGASASGDVGSAPVVRGERAAAASVPAEPAAPTLERRVAGPAPRARLRAPESEPALVASGAPTIPVPASAPDGPLTAEDPTGRDAVAAHVVVRAGERDAVGEVVDAASSEQVTVSAASAAPPDGPGDVAADPAPKPPLDAASLPAAPPSAPIALPAVPVEPARGGDWVVELGTVANGEEGRARWRELRRAHGDALSSVARLGGDAAGPGPLLAGPFADREEAERACARLAGATECRVTRL